MWIALAIVFSAVLFLVDKNQAWATFWKVMRRASITAVIVSGVSVGSFYIYRASHPPAWASDNHPELHTDVKLSDGKMLRFKGDLSTAEIRQRVSDYHDNKLSRSEVLSLN